MDCNDVKPDKYYLDENNTPNFKSGAIDTTRFYDMNLDGVTPDKLEKSNYISPSDKKDMEDIMIDKQSKQASIIDNITSKEHVFKPDTWQYKNEMPMNGGSFNGLTGFDSLGGNYAIYSKTELEMSTPHPPSSQPMPESLCSDSTATTRPRTSAHLLL